MMQTSKQRKRSGALLHLETRTLDPHQGISHYGEGHSAIPLPQSDHTQSDHNGTPDPRHALPSRQPYRSRPAASPRPPDRNPRTPDVPDALLGRLSGGTGPAGL